MAENPISELKNKSLFARLKRLFSTDVIVRNTGGKKLKIIDTDEIQFSTDRNSLQDRFNRLRSTGYNQYSRDFNLSYQSSRIELFRDFDCVGPDTIIPLPDGTFPTISELTEKYKDSPNERFQVFSYDHETDSIKLGNAYYPRKKEGGKRKSWKVIFDNDQYVIGSAGHPFLMKNGDYKKLEELTVGEYVMPFFQKHFYNQQGECTCLYNFSNGWQPINEVIKQNSISTDQAITDSTVNLVIKSIEYVGEMDVYDVTVEKYQNFATDSCFVHNTMAMDPILASALDIYADECTSKNELGEILAIRSTNDDIKSILENLFYDILNIEFNLWSWTRSLVKYGDFYLKLYISPEYGVYLVEPMSSYNVTRLENFNNENKNDVKFEINMPEGNGLDTLENYQVAHFRLLQDSNFIPYGTSMLEGARRIWKQLCLHENTRIWTPNGFKYIKDIKSGDEVYSFDYNTGELIQTVVKDCKFMGKQDTYKIKTLHRSIITTDKHGMLVCDKNGNFLYKATKDIEIGLDNLVLPDKNNPTEYTLEPVIDVAFYEKESNTWDLEVNHDLHNFVAEGVVSHNTLMEDAMLIHRIMRAPEKRIFKIDIGNIPPNEVDNYMEQIMNKMKKVPYVDEKTGDYNLRFNLQNMVEDFYLPVRGSDSGTSIDPLSGLDWTGTEDIEYLRNKLMSALKIPKAFLGYEEGLCISPETKIPLVNGQVKTVKQLIEDFKAGIKNYTYSINESTKEITIGEIEGAGYTRLNAEVVRVHLNNNKYIDCTPDHLFMTDQFEWVKAQDLVENQKLTSFIPINLGDKSEEYPYKYILLLNPRTTMFKKATDVIKSSLDTDALLEQLNDQKNIQLEYNFENEGGLYNSVIKVEKLSEKIDTCDLTIKHHHNFATDSGVFIHNSGKATLAAEDIRFARTIQRIQRIVVSELNKIAVIHLYSQGYRDESLVDFELQLTNPSTIFEKEKIEIWKSKVELTSDMQESKLFSKKWIYENVFNMSDKDMIELQKQLIDDSKSMFRFKQIEEEGKDPAIAYLKKSEEESPEGDSPEEGPSDEAPDEAPEKSPVPPVQLKEKKTKKRDQTGKKDARKYPFGEDPLGTLENNRKSDLSSGYSYSNKSPLSLESYTNMLEKIDNDLLLIESKNNKIENETNIKSYMDEDNIK